jgi:uracil-DNA glycosylase
MGSGDARDARLGTRGRMKRSLPVMLEAQLEAHGLALAGCRRCGHGDEVRPIASPARAPKAMLVGQAPGKVESVGGRPFAGRAGRTLFRWLDRIGLDEETARHHIYIAAVTRCYPGPSSSGRGDRVPSPRERELCGTWLDEELRIIRPRVIIPVGRLAIDRFLGSEPLDRVIGRAHDVQHPGGRSVAIPLPHPSGASSWIHQADHQAKLDAALRLLASHLTELRIILPSSTRRSVA